VEDLIERIIRWVRHPLRILALLVATWSLVGGFVGWAGLTSALIAALAAAIIGELVGRTSVRAPILVAAAALPMIVGVVAELLATRLSIVPAMLGTWVSLNLGSFLVCGGMTFGVVFGLRALAHRSGAANAVELASLSAAYAAAFAAHRFGAVARPLWLSDMAWDLGFDPATILLLLGGMFVVLLALIRLADSDKRLSMFGALLLPAIAVIAVLVIDPRRLQQPAEAAEVAEMKTAMGEPPRSSSDNGLPNKRSQGEGTADGKATGLQPDVYKSHSQGEGGKSGDAEAAGNDAKREGPAGAESNPDPSGDKNGGQGGKELKEAPMPKNGTQDPNKGQGGDQNNEDKSKGGQSNRPPRHDQRGEGGKDRPVAVVVLGDDYAPPSQYFYLRQAALTKFDGHRLVQTSRNDVDLDVPKYFPTRAENPKQRPSHAGRVEVHGRVGVLARHDQPFALEGVDALAPAPNGNPARFERMYEFTSWPMITPYDELVGHQAGDPSWTPEQWAEYTEVPKDPRYKTLADELVATLPEEVRDDPFARALVIKAYLDKNMKYSKKERHAGVDDPTADFLFGNFIGYCVHSSHAATYLWREVGIPARVGTGYAVEEAKRRGSSLVVMGGNAHAWPELYLDGLGWVILDIAPSENLDPPGDPVDEDMTKLLSEMARENKANTPKTDYRWVRDALVDAIKGAALTIAIGVIVGHYLVKLWRRMRVTLSSTRAMPRVAFRAALDMLVESGFVRSEGETREAFARRVAEQLPSFERLTTLHLAAQFGDPARPQRGRPEFDRSVYVASLLGVQRELRAARGAGWRWLGLVNPISFYWAR
jgi:transglutaminase-like putative cysteine protease